MVLGNHDAERLSIVSFVVRHGDDGQFLHHNFVVALLNDLFGIQSRGGCSCAGPYGHRLLGIDLDRSHEFQREINRGARGSNRAGFGSNFNYFIDEPTFRYIVDAVHLVAEHGAALMPEYRFEPDTGLWHHRDARTDPAMSLLDISYADGEMHYENRRVRGASDFGAHLADARRRCTDAQGQAAGSASPRRRPTTSNACAGFRIRLRWLPTSRRRREPSARRRRVRAGRGSAPTRRVDGAPRRDRGTAASGPLDRRLRRTGSRDPPGSVVAPNTLTSISAGSRPLGRTPRRAGRGGSRVMGGR